MRDPRRCVGRRSQASRLTPPHHSESDARPGADGAGGEHVAGVVQAQHHARGGDKQGKGQQQDDQGRAVGDRHQG